jgi:hypothetical protein
MRSPFRYFNSWPEVIIPHARLWSTSLFNASSGKQSLLCVTDF